MFFSLDIQRARKGDCLLLHYGTRKDPGLMLIDGGPGQVYDPYLRPRLMQLIQLRGLGSGQPLPLDLCIVSHIDGDHITGVLELTNELVNTQDSREPQPFKVKGIWHNTFDDIIGNSPDELVASVQASYGAAALGGEPDTEGLEPSAAGVLAGIEQGYRLRADVGKLRLRINPEFSGGLVMAENKGKSIAMGKKLTFLVAGPMKGELIALQKDYDDWLKNPDNKKKAKAALASFTDVSVPNLSSIVILAQVGKKRMLFTGDARGDKILQGLELTGRLKQGGEMHVDILKMPHHGSDRNIDPVFFQRIVADHYVFSGNGEYGNPERETLQMLLDARGGEEFTIHCTYPIDEIDVERKKDWQRQQQKEKSGKKKNPKLAVRENWSPKKHGLTAFFKDNKDFAKKVSIVEEGKPYVIDLFDKVGF
jgi:beta-lactamase superfamily II metal-dependent hydrolase